MFNKNSSTQRGRICSDVEMDVLKTAAGEGRTVVTFDIIQTHPHDLRRKDGKQRAQFHHIRTYGKLAEAAKRNLQHGDEVEVFQGVVVQDRWLNKVSKQWKDRYFLEPTPSGLEYITCRRLGIGTPPRDKDAEKPGE